MNTKRAYHIGADRESGQATTSHLFSDKDEAYRHALDTQTPDTCTTVVARRTAPSRKTVQYC